MHAGSITALLSQAPKRQTALLFGTMLVGRLTEGIGLLLLVPLLELVGGQPGQAVLSHHMSGALGYFGIRPSIGPLLFLFVGLVAFRAILLFAQQAIAARYQFGVVDQYRKRLFTQLLCAEWRWLSNQRATDMASHLVTGVGRIGAGLNQVIALIAGLTTLIAYVSTSLILSWRITIIALAVGLVVHLFFAPLRKQAMRLGQAIGVANRALQANVQEGLAAVRRTKLERAEQRQQDGFSNTVDQLRREQIAYSISVGMGDAALQTGGAAALAMIVYAGIVWLALPFAVLLTVVLIFTRLLPIFSNIQQSYNQWLHARPAVEELDQLLADSAMAAEPSAAAEPTPLPLAEAIIVDRLGFAYDSGDRSVLRDVSFQIGAGTLTAITGPSGSGKSTLADLLTGLVEPDSGSISIDGVPLTGPARQCWRASIAYVQQDGFLFHDSIRANLAWAHPYAGDDDINDALRAAAADFVFALPQGLDTVVGDAGQKLSGGERQRLALARALLGKPSLLILDEATSALDLDNEMLINQSLDALRGKLTIVVISHRHLALDRADQILKIDAGTISISRPRR
jgi:ATP-binding cassette, subfamily C, bacterial